VPVAEIIPLTISALTLQYGNKPSSCSLDMSRCRAESERYPLWRHELITQRGDSMSDGVHTGGGHQRRLSLPVL